MVVAIITDYVVHAATVLVICTLDGFIPLRILRAGDNGIPPYTANHEIVHADAIRPSKIMDPPLAVADAHVSNARAAASYGPQRAPDYGIWEAVVDDIHSRALFPEHHLHLGMHEPGLLVV